MDHLQAIPNVEISDKTCEDLKQELIICMKKQKNCKTAIDTISYMKMVENYFDTIDQYIIQKSYIVNTIMYRAWFQCFWDACRITAEVRCIAIKTFASNNYIKAFKTNIPFWYAKYLLETNIILIKEGKIKFNFVNGLANNLKTATNWPKQITILQSIIEIRENDKESSNANIKNIIRQNFQDNIELYALFCSIDVGNIDSCARRILNIINADRCPPNIFSMLCTKAQLDQKQLQYESDTEELWTDFNLIERTITVQCKLSCLLDAPSFSELDNNLTETITVDFDSITLVREKTWWYKKTEGKLIMFDLNQPCHCVYASARDPMDKVDCLMLFIGSNENLEKFLKLLVQTFRTKFRGSGSQSTSKVQVAQNDDSIENQVQGNSSSRMCTSMFSGYDGTNDNQSFSLHLPAQSKTIVNIPPYAEEMVSVREKHFCNKISKATSNRQSNLDIYNKGDNGVFLNRPQQPEAKLNEDDDDSIIESSQENIPQTQKILRKIKKIHKEVNPNMYNPLAQLQQHINLPTVQPETLTTDTNPQLPVAPEYNYASQTPKRNSNYQRSRILKTPGTSSYHIATSYALSGRTEIPQSLISRAQSAKVIDEINLVSSSGEFQHSLHSPRRLNGSEGDLELSDSFASPSHPPSDILSANWSYISKSPKSTPLKIPEKAALVGIHSPLKIKSKPTAQVVTQSQNSEMDFQPRAFSRKTPTPNIDVQISHQQESYSNNWQTSNLVQVISSGNEPPTDQITQSSSADFQPKIVKRVTNNHKSFTYVPETNLSQNNVLSQNLSTDAVLVSRVPVNIVRKPRKYQKKKIQAQRLNKSLNSFLKESSENVPPRNFNVTPEEILNSVLNDFTELSPKKLDLQPSLPLTPKQTSTFNTTEQNLANSQNVKFSLSKNCSPVVQPLRRLTPILESILSEIPQNSAFPMMTTSSNLVDHLLPISQMPGQSPIQRQSREPSESSNNTIIQSSKNGLQSLRTLYNPTKSLNTRSNFQKSLINIPSVRRSNIQPQPEIIFPVSSPPFPAEMLDTTLIPTTSITQSPRTPERILPHSTDFPQNSKSYIENVVENPLHVLAEAAARSQKISSPQNYVQPENADRNSQNGDTNLNMTDNTIPMLEISGPSPKRRRGHPRKSAYLEADMSINSDVDTPAEDISFMYNEITGSQGKSLTTARNDNSGDEMTRYVMRYFTKTRMVTKTGRYADQLNDTYLKKHSEEIRRTTEIEEYDEEVVLKGTPAKSINPECFNKTTDHIISCCRDTNLSIKHKPKKKHHRYTPYIVISFDTSTPKIRLRKANKTDSVSNNTLELFTQEPSTPSDNFIYSQMQNEARPEYSTAFHSSLRVEDRKQLVESNLKSQDKGIQKQYNKGVKKYFSTIKLFSKIFHQVENMDNISEKKEWIKNILNNSRNLDSVYDVAKRKFSDSE